MPIDRDNNRILQQSSLKDAVQIINEEMEKTLDIIAPHEENKKPEKKKAMVY